MTDPCPICKQPLEPDFDPEYYNCYDCGNSCCEECRHDCSESGITKCEDCRMREARYWEQEYRRAGGAAGAQERKREAALSQMQQDDPVAFYIACKDDPGTLDAQLEERGL